MWQIERQIENLLRISSDNMMLTMAVVFVGGVLAIWVVCNGFGK
jgi:hypothetical protein